MQATIDTSLDHGICDWLVRIGAGRTCDRSIRSGYAEYPLFQFDEVFLKDANPESYAGLLTE